jgi:BirA family transcriptional regulator, biotin operon repressor / biotin---[acetyl-CoA-carboxylase] ligase
VSVIGCERRLLAECASTNDEAAAWARAGAPHGAIVIADSQTRGRGRLGRAWHSPPGAALYFSAILRPSLPLPRLPPLTLAVGVALAEAVARFDVQARLKWPNDLLVGGKKLAGILAESATQGGRLEHVIVGIGVNLHVGEFPPGLSAVSLHRYREVGRDEFVAVLCERLESWYGRFLAGESVAPAWKQFADCWGRELVLSTGERGVAEDLDEDGALRLRTANGLVRVSTGEVTAAGPTSS